MLDGPRFLQIIGLSVGFFLTLVAWRSKGEPLAPAAYRLLFAAPLIFVGGKAWYLLENRLPPTVPHLVGPGYGLFGSVLLVLLGWVLWQRWEPFPLLKFLDCVTPAAAAGLIFGRWSCFLRGCCTGLPTGGDWGVRLDPTALLYAEYVRRGWLDGVLDRTVLLHPTQLYAAAFAAVAFVLLWYFLRRNPPEGQIFLSGVLAYGLFRLIEENVRLHAVQATTIGPLYPSQWLSLAAAVLALTALWIRRQ